MQEVLGLLGGVLEGRVMAYIKALCDENAADLLCRPLQHAFSALCEARSDQVPTSLVHGLLQLALALHAHWSWLVGERFLLLITALGDQALPPLLAILQTEVDAAVRRAAAWALGQIGSERAVDALLARLQDEDTAAEVRQTAAEALRLIGQRRERVVPIAKAPRSIQRQARAWRSSLEQLFVE
jgi:hypothetical protein